MNYQIQVATTTRTIGGADANSLLAGMMLGAVAANLVWLAIFAAVAFKRR